MRKRILVIDDDELLLGALDSFLSHEKFQVLAIGRSIEIRDAIVDFKPELIVMDIRLDKCDGRIICDKIKLYPATAHIPIILLSGLAYDEIANIDCQADAIIGKPFESSSLITTINQLLF